MKQLLIIEVNIILRDGITEENERVAIKSNVKFKPFVFIKDHKPYCHIEFSGSSGEELKFHWF